MVISPNRAPVTPNTIPDRKSTRLNSSHDQISYAVFCLKKKKKHRCHISRGVRLDRGCRHVSQHFVDFYRHKAAQRMTVNELLCCLSGVSQLTQLWMSHL